MPTTSVSLRVQIVLRKFHGSDECCMQIEWQDMVDRHITYAQALLSYLTSPGKYKMKDEIKNFKMSTVCHRC